MYFCFFRYVDLSRSNITLTVTWSVFLNWSCTLICFMLLSSVYIVKRNDVFSVMNDTTWLTLLPPRLNQIVFSYVVRFPWFQMLIHLKVISFYKYHHSSINLQLASVVRMNLLITFLRKPFTNGSITNKMVLNNLIQSEYKYVLNTIQLLRHSNSLDIPTL